MPTLPHPSWIDANRDLLIAIGSDRFPVALRTMLGLACRFDSMLITAFAGTATPRSLYHDLDDTQALLSVEYYGSGPYLRDPLFQACRNDIAPGAYRMADVTDGGFLNSDYYLNFFRKVRIFDELGVLLRFGPQSWVIISLARSRTRAEYTPQERDDLNSLFPLVEAAIQKQWPQLATPETKDQPAHIAKDRLRDFATDLLSPRESEIIQLILQGHSTKTIASFLNIAAGTVKVHRHHAYSKLGIGSQSELFALSTRYLIDTQGIVDAR
jgi:DNA-binding CsgD family transcriptional regulator